MVTSEEPLIKSLHRWRKAVVHLAEMEDELLEQGMLPFTAEIMKGNRITIPQEVMERLNLEVNDWILVPVSKLSQTEIPPKRRRKVKQREILGAKG